jgi:hypothetical protein
MTATGLQAAEVATLSPAQRRTLVAWTLAKAGGNLAIAPFVPAAIRRMPLERRLELADSPTLDAAWEEQQRRRVRRDWVYFVDGYGSIQPPTGPRVPFALWERQRDLAEHLRDHLRWVLPKARQLGLTWLALHDAVHLLAFDETETNARVLGLSRTGGDASKLLMRARAIADHLPPFLRPLEAADTRRSMTRYGITGRGEMISLMGTPDAARMETATLAILDEFAFYRNRGAGPTWTAAQPTLGTTGRAYVISTGNGDEDTPGDGQAFAQLVRKALGGEADETGKRLRCFFLPASTDPARRDPGWREAEREAYLDPIDFEREHPETIEQALQGPSGSKVYPLSAIAAATRYGAELDALRSEDKLPPPAPPERSEIVAIDWGEQTHALELWPLEAGGFYVMREVAHANDEPENLVGPLLGKADSKPGAAHYDAAGIQSMRTFLATARRSGWPRLRSVKIPFGTYKEQAIKYTRRLLRRTERLLEAREAWEREHGMTLAEALERQAKGERLDHPPPALRQMLAISPTGCPELLRQMRGLEFADDDAGKIDKGDDHGPDALLAGVAKAARRFADASTGERAQAPD